MRYLLLICSEHEPPATLDDENINWDEQEANVEPWLRETSDVRLLSSRLAVPADATTVRVRDGKVLYSDGPFAETKEWIAGIDLIECADLDEAIEIASKHPVASFGKIEVRPLHPEVWREKRPYPGKLM